LAQLLVQEAENKDDPQKKALAEFKGSHGYVTNFMARFGFRHQRLSGESAGVDLQTVAEGRQAAADLAKDYTLDCIYNMDEAALWFAQLPRVGIGRSGMHGTKENKSRVSLVFIVNADGSDKRKLIVLNKAKCPVVFRGINLRNLPITYKSTVKGCWC
jgi:hypothetical protein